MIDLQCGFWISTLQTSEDSGINQLANSENVDSCNHMFIVPYYNRTFSQPGHVLLVDIHIGPYWSDLE